MNKIKQLRLEKGITVKDLAEKIGISQSMLSNYENGNSTPRNNETWKKLADFFEVDVAYLMGLSLTRTFSDRDTFEKYIDTLDKQGKSITTNTSTDFTTLKETFTVIIQDDLIKEIFSNLNDDNKDIVISVADALRKSQLFETQNDLPNE